MNTTLLIMAAGIGSRFGTGIKQLEPVDASNHIIMDYSIHDAIEAGFNHVVFIIRKDIEKEFKEVIGDRIAAICSAHDVTVDYAFQDINDIPGILPEGRTKPWGTAQALYCCKDALDGDFAVINADDFYGAKAFAALAEFFRNPTADACSVDFLLKNTLSENGPVNRGICRKSAEGLLTSVEETKQISRGADGVIRGKYDGYEKILGDDDTTSMSMWGFKIGFMDILAHQLRKFLNNLQPDELKAELTIAEAVSREIASRGYKVKDIPTDSRWFGITYESDASEAKKTLSEYVEKGVYKSPL